MDRLDGALIIPLKDWGNGLACRHFESTREREQYKPVIHRILGNLQGMHWSVGNKGHIPGSL